MRSCVYRTRHSAAVQAQEQRQRLPQLLGLLWLVRRLEADARLAHKPLAQVLEASASMSGTSECIATTLQATGTLACNSSPLLTHAQPCACMQVVCRHVTLGACPHLQRCIRSLQARPHAAKASEVCRLCRAGRFPIIQQPVVQALQGTHAGDSADLQQSHRCS